jgi:hypothetical protein
MYACCYINGQWIPFAQINYTEAQAHPPSNPSIYAPPFKRDLYACLFNNGAWVPGAKFTLTEVEESSATVGVPVMFDAYVGALIDQNPDAEAAANFATAAAADAHRAPTSSNFAG